MCKWKPFREEFTISRLKLEYSYDEDFSVTRWQATRRVDEHYLIYRCLHFMCFLLTVYVKLRLTPSEKLVISLVYFTYWSFGINFAHSMLGLFAVCRAYIKQQDGKPEDHNSRFLHKCYLICFNISICFAICVVFVFWFGVRYMKEDDTIDTSKYFHTWTAIIVVMDFFVTSVPIYLLLVVPAQAIGLIYAIFNFAYCKSGGQDYYGNNYIYPKFKWNEDTLEPILYTVLTLSQVLLVHLSLFGMHLVKVHFFHICYKDNKERRSFD
ncbi:PREDICTED: protein rolling stone-like [Nicrophorus vespilloides]|uniref:Protein rolling stone-like n=1 Tax=Nicrophorus vespilloides TaxID=110193 RepID=A0ABM1MSM3_NICVS|nr:PREDICTED: protein rolling stone-like [Nicrophorus vespilloides]